MDYLIDPTFRNINTWFVLSFKNSDDDPTRYPFNKCDNTLVEIKDFDALIDKKTLLDQPVRNKQEAYEKLVKMSINDDYTTGNLLYYLYDQKYYKLIDIDLSRQTNTKCPSTN